MAMIPMTYGGGIKIKRYTTDNYSSDVVTANSYKTTNFSRRNNIDGYTAVMLMNVIPTGSPYRVACVVRSITENNFNSVLINGTDANTTALGTITYDVLYIRNDLLEESPY